MIQDVADSNIRHVLYLAALCAAVVLAARIRDLIPDAIAKVTMF